MVDSVRSRVRSPANGPQPVAPRQPAPGGLSSDTRVTTGTAPASRQAESPSDSLDATSTTPTSTTTSSASTSGTSTPSADAPTTEPSATSGTSSIANTTAATSTPSNGSGRPVLDPLDRAFTERFEYTEQPLANGKKLYSANIAIFEFQRAFNRLAARIAAEKPELVARYQERLGAPFPFPLSVDGQLGPKSNVAKQLLQEFLGEPADAETFTESNWRKLISATEAASPAPWVTLAFDRSALASPVLTNAADVFERLAHEDPLTLMKLCVALGVPKETSWSGFSVTTELVAQLAGRLAQAGIPLTDERAAALYDLDRTGLGGVTLMRARGAAELIIELERMDVHTHDELIRRSVAWIRESEPRLFERFTATSGAADPELVLAALIKAVMSAESDFDRIQDFDLTDLGLMQLTRPVTTDKTRYFAGELPSGATATNAANPSGTPPGFPSNTMEPLRNTAAGGSLLADLFNRFGGKLTLTAAAYNVGPNKAELNLPDGRARIPNYYPTLMHGMRIQRRFPFYLEQLRREAAAGTSGAGATTARPRS